MSEARWWISASWPTVDADEFDKPTLIVEIGDYRLPWAFEATVFRADVRGEPVGDWPPIRMKVQMHGARPEIRELTIGAPPAPPLIVTGEERERLSDEQLEELARTHDEAYTQASRHSVTASMMRELPLARLARYAMLGVAHRVNEGPVVPSDFRDGPGGSYRIGPGETELGDLYGVYIIDTPAWEDLWSEHMQALAAQAERASTATRRNRITDEHLERVAHVYRRAIAERRPPKKAVREAWHVSEATAGRYIMRARERGYLGNTRRGKKGELDEKGRPA
jgi:hypothetical protein